MSNFLEKLEKIKRIADKMISQQAPWIRKVEDQAVREKELESKRVGFIDE